MKAKNPSDQYKAIKKVEKAAGVSFGVAASAYSASGGNIQKAIQVAKGLRKNPRNGNDSSVRSPTSTSTEVRSPTRTRTATSTDATTTGNITVTGGAGAGATTVTVHQRKLPDDPISSSHPERLKNRKNPAKFDRCVKEVKAKGGAVSPYAVCTAAGARNPRVVRIKGKLNPMTGPMVASALSHSAAGRKASAAIQKLFAKKRVANPIGSAEQMYEMFHGLPPEEIIEIIERVHVHSKLWVAGMLIQMKVETLSGRAFDLNAPDPDESPIADVVYMCMNETYVKNGVTIEAGTQAYFIGGDQEIPEDLLVKKLGFKEDDIREQMTIGWVTEVTYRTRKSFEKNGEELVDFFHPLGKEHSRGALPMLTYKPRDPGFAWYGGRYKILPVRGDINASPGIGG